MAFLSSGKGLGNILKKNSKSTAYASGLTRRQSKLSPAISSLSARPPGFFRSQWRSLSSEKNLDLEKYSQNISESTALCSELGRRHTNSSPAISPPVCPANRKGTFARNVSDKSPQILSDSTALGHGLTRRQPKLSPAISLSPSVTPPGFHFARNGVPFVRKRVRLMPLDLRGVNRC